MRGGYNTIKYRARYSPPDGLDSRDDADVLALTFARHVAPEDPVGLYKRPYIYGSTKFGWMAV